MGSTNAKVLQLHKAVVEDDADKVSVHFQGRERHFLVIDNTYMQPNIKNVQLLLEEELDLTARGNGDLNTLQLAIAHGSLKCLPVILDTQSGKADLYSLTPDRQTPLIMAASKGHEDMALGFLKSFPSNTLRLEHSDASDHQALHYACIRGHAQLVTQLLQAGVAVDTVGGKLKHTPLMLAVHHGHMAVARILLNSGAHVCAIDLAKMTPLHHACMQGSEDCVRLLLEQENSRDWVDSKDISGCTPLLYCLNAKNKPIEKLLVSKGASLTEALDGGFSEYCYHTSQSNS